MLADQINRGLPKTQSAMLQAMEGEAINVAHETFRLPQPFFVLATQNPLEMEGTFPLPEPEIDRFFFKLLVSPPDAGQIEQILERTTEGEPPQVKRDRRRQAAAGDAAAGPGDFAFGPELRRLAVALVAATQSGASAGPGAGQAVGPLRQQSARAQAIVLAAKIRAAAAGRDAVDRDDLLRRSIPRCGIGCR